MQVAINGLISGLSIATLATAFSVVYLPTRVFHIALAGIYALAPYVAFACLKSGLAWWLAVLAAILVTLAVSLLCEIANHRPLESKGASSGVHLVSSIGIQIVIVQIIALVWGNQAKVLRTEAEQVFRVGDLILTLSQLTEAGIAALVLGSFLLWLRHSRLGLQFRALADNPTELALRGYNISRLRLLAFGISGVLVGVISLCDGFDVGFDPYAGMHAFLLAVVAMILGGRNTFLGPVLGGILLGLSRSEVVWFLSANWQEAITFLLLTTFLLLRPYGLAGRKNRLEAEL